MRIFFLLFISITTYGQTYINNDTTINGTLSGRLIINAKISGSCTVQNATIEASPFMQIFDTTVTIGSNVFTREFSGMWFGAKPSNANNNTQLQMAINASINRPYKLYIPAGVYKTTQPLMVVLGEYNNYQQAKIRMYGEGSYWDNGYGGTQIVYDGDSCAIGFQLNKGSEVRNLIISGKWVSPTTTGSTYYNTSEADYTNQAASGNGSGIWVDPSGSWNQRSGSTGVLFENIKVEKFHTLVQISNRGGTQNGEIILFNNLQLGDGKYGIVGNQAQEKYNRFTGVFSWGKIYTVFKISHGNYYFDGANIAGSCIRIMDIISSGWFPVYFDKIYAEHFATIGKASTTMPMSISNSVFDFVTKSEAGEHTLFNGNSNRILFSNSLFRYYGNSDDMKFSGSASFNNCIFSGVVTGVTGYVYTNYGNGTYTANGTNIIIKQDTTVSKNNSIITIKPL